MSRAFVSPPAAADRSFFSRLSLHQLIPVIQLAIVALCAFAISSPAHATVYFVNDTSTVGDSFTSAVGSDANSGLSISLPKRTLNALEGLMAAGDTIYVDSGFFYEPDTFTIGADSIWVIGVDSLSTRIRFDDSSSAGIRAIFATGRKNLTLRNFSVTNGRRGIWWINVDQSTIHAVKADSNGAIGIAFLNNCDTNRSRRTAPPILT